MSVKINFDNLEEIKNKLYEHSDEMDYELNKLSNVLNSTDIKHSQLDDEVDVLKNSLHDHTIDDVEELIKFIDEISNNFDELDRG